MVRRSSPFFSTSSDHEIYQGNLSARQAYINYLSDGASAHFKNNKNLLNLTLHQSDFVLPASWTFSATSHGKGPVDGIGAAIKSRATRHLLTLQGERAFLTQREFYDFIDRATDHQKMIGDLEPNRPITVFYASSDQIETTYHTVLSDRWSTLPKQWIKGIKQFHRFDPNGPFKVVCRETSTSLDSEEFHLDS